MRNAKPPKRPAGMTPKMEKDLRQQMASNTAVMKDPSIKSVNPTFGGLAGRAVASAYMRGKASDNKKIDDMVKDLASTVKIIRSEANSGIRGSVTPINSKQIADMARRYAQKEKSVLPEIKNLTSRQKQMVRDEIARQYKKPTLADKAKDVVDKAKVMAKKVNKKMPSITALSIAAQNPNNQTTNLNEVIVKPKTYRMGGALKPVPSEKKGLSKLPTEVRNKMGYMMGGGKMEYAMGGMMENKIKRLENREKSLVARGSKAVDEGRERKADRLLGRAARVENRLIKAKESAPVKKMMGGGKLDMMYAMGGKMDVHDPKGLAHVGSKGAKAPLSTPYNKTKDNNSYISNDVDMSPAIKKQMMALRQAMMYFTGVSPKNK
jgi:hypothetical protein